MGDGEDALELLANSRASESLRPDLVVLDIGLPSRNGFQVLEVLKMDDALRQLPVILLTQSDQPADEARARELSVSRFITKPHDLAGYREVAQQIAEFAQDHC